MTTLNDLPPPCEPHQALARVAASQWARQHPLKAVLVRVLARLVPASREPLCHLLEHCPETSQEDLEALLDRWCCHWHGSLASTSQGRLQLDLRDRLNDARLDQQGW